MGKLKAPQTITINQPAVKLAYTVEETAALISMGKTNVYALIKSGRLKVVHTGEKGRGIIVPRAEIDAFLAREAH